jgi:alanyl-tRNA synthetase
MKASDVRNRFIEYFKRHAHTHVASSRLIPENDPTLLFTNSGMVQFKNVFLGFDQRNYKRATTAQKCVRAGGKHNDLENVGHTSRHHTFFEMLGNFSFGDYFKTEAIKFAWDFLTNDLKIPKDRLYVTVHVSDDEASLIWENQEKVPKERISRFDADNFWQMGDTGPCGPCSEIFYDHGEKYGCGKSDCKVGCSCDRFVEIWNLVFMQFNKDAEGKITPLPKPSIDTGSGLERVTAVMQNVASNYETDLFTDLFKVMEQVSGQKYLRENLEDEVSIAMRVMADHARCATFLIADGVIPSNEGQGYVLRRIMRRGIRYGRKLGARSVLVPTAKKVIEMMSVAYPELKQREGLILSTLENEESKFGITLDTGNALLSEVLEKLKTSKIKTLPGETVFKLYDTYGFPLDLTSVIAKENGFEIDEMDFTKRMEQQKVQAKASWKGDVSSESSVGKLMQAAGKLGQTNFIGYESFEVETKVLALFSLAGESMASLAGEGFAVFQDTPFYAEGGGQVGDQGSGKNPTSKSEFKISNTKKIGSVYFHEIHGASRESLSKSPLKVGDTVELSVSSERRATMNNHSATHLLHAALRNVLGSHVGQAGSLVEPKRLRFDFTHSKPLSPSEVSQVEELVNQEIAASHQVGSKILPYKEAINSGAMAMFGEKYGDQVRVIKMGEFSTELCGGTHVPNTSVIRLFKIMSESGVSSGVRRIEAITGEVAVKFLLNRHQQLNQIEGSLKSEEGKALEKINKLSEQNKKLERDLKQAKTQGPGVNADTLLTTVRKVKDTSVISAVVDLDDRELLSSLADKLKDKIQSGIIILIGSSGESGASPIVVSVSKDLATRFHAGNILKSVASLMDGKGGGRPDFAQGSAPNSAKAHEAAAKAFDLI